jgi:WD40 repeat protein
MLIFDESHNNEVTGLTFRDEKYFLSCSLDNLVSFFDLNHTEQDDMIDGAYAST